MAGALKAREHRQNAGRAYFPIQMRNESSKPVGVVVTGGRNLTPTRCQLDAFWRLFDRLGGTVLHHGDAPGVDRAVAADARRRRPDVRIEPHPAKWSLYGKRAGPMRNHEMAVLGVAVVAFPGGAGTANCCEQARHAGRPVLQVDDELDRYRQELERELIDPGLWSDP